MSIDDERIATWEQLRAVAHRKQGLTRVGVERGGSQIELTITPRAGRLGVGPYYETEKLSLSAALAHGIKLPFVIVGESARSFMRIGAGRDKADFQGFLAGIPLFDAAASWVFRAMHPRAAQSALRGYRLERLRVTLLLGASGCVTVALAAALTSAGLPAAVVLVLWAMPAATATYPLIWIAGNEVWPRGIVLGAMGVALIVPCLPLLIVLGLLRDLRLALEREGFRAGWFRADPA